MTKKASKNKPFKVFLIIFCLMIASVLLVVGIGGGIKINGKSITKDYIAVLPISGTIASTSDSQETGYDHNHTLVTLEKLMEDESNKGLVLFIDSPGGGVYATDEAYMMIKEYQDKTGRPVYAAMGEMATSGGYYLAAPSKKIFANRNTLTGSIGVRLSTMYDVSEFLDKHGIKVTTITAGKNKAMGDVAVSLTDEQKEIYQSIVDESYDQFVDVVADGREMSLSKVKKLADGRVYTAKQAKENGLIDEIGTVDDAISSMMVYEKLRHCTIKTYNPPEVSLIDQLLASVDKLSLTSESQSIESIMDLNGESGVSIDYICDGI